MSRHARNKQQNINQQTFRHVKADIKRFSLRPAHSDSFTSRPEGQKIFPKHESVIKNAFQSQVASRCRRSGRWQWAPWKQLTDGDERRDKDDDPLAGPRMFALLSLRRAVKPLKRATIMRRF